MACDPEVEKASAGLAGDVPSANGTRGRTRKVRAQAARAAQAAQAARAAHEALGRNGVRRARTLGSALG